jgi:hypothetical protein
MTHPYRECLNRYDSRATIWRNAVETLELVKGSALVIPAKPSTSSQCLWARFARQTVVRLSQRVQDSRSGPHNGLEKPAA